MNGELGRDAEDWLRRFKWALATMPASERDDIVAETRAHVAERLAQGQAALEVLAGFGEPDAYARHFIDEMELARVMGSQGSGAMLNAVLRRAHRSSVAAGALLLVLAMAAVAFPIVMTAINKLFDPVHAGLWRGPNEFFIGIIDQPENAQELLGVWIYPLAGLCLALIWLAIRFVLVWAVKSLARTA